MQANVKKTTKLKKDGTPWLPRKEFKKTQQALKKNVSKAPPKTKKTPTVLPIKAADERRAKPNTVVLLAPGQTNSLLLDVKMDRSAIDAVMVGYCTLAIERGFLAYAKSPSQLYWAYVYGIQGIVSAAQGTTMTVTKAPKWYVALCQALSPKNAGFDLAGVTYKWTIDNASAPPAPTFLAAPISYSYEWLTYVPSGFGADGFPKGVAPIAYSAQDGQDAWALLIEFMAQAFKETRVSENNSLIDFSSKTQFYKDTSAFAQNFLAEGWGGGTLGGQATLVGSEIAIHNPILANFATTAPNGGVYSPSRYPTFVQSQSGTSMVLGTFLPLMAPMKEYHAKRPMRIHCVDFLEFGDVMARYVSKLQGLRYKDIDAENSIKEPLQYQCPITLQEMLLLLRNEILYILGGYQAGLQSVYPRAPTSGTDNEFGPFICGTTTAPISQQNMKLPKLLVENVKSIVARVVYYHGTIDPQWLVCSIGQYVLDVLVSTDYTFESFSSDDPGMAVTEPSFVVEPPLFRARRGSKGESQMEKVGVEAAIDLVDGASGSDYLFINDTTRLKQLVTLWNNWIETLSAYSTPLVTLSRDLGVNILCSAAITRHWKNAAPRQAEIRREFIDMRLQAKKFTATPYAAREVFAVSSRSALLSGPTDEILQLWVLPTNKIDTGSTIANSTGFTRYCSYNHEGHSVSTSSTGEQGTSLAMLHENYASAMVQARDTPASEISRFLDQMDSKGEGGMLTSFVSDCLGKAFGPEVGGITKAIAGILPI